MINKVNKRKISNSGFSISEMLIAVLILLMVSSVVAAGVPVAANAYRKVVDASNAESLLSTTVTILRTDLSVAELDDADASGTSISYKNKNTGVSYTISVGADAEGIQIDNGSVVTQLVATQKSMKNLYASYSSVSSAEGVITFSDLAVYKADGTQLTDKMDLKIRRVTYTD